MLVTKKNIVLHNVYHKYENSDKWILKDVDYEFKSDQIYCLVGPSGIGKSTLLRVIGNVLKPTSGTVEIPNVFCTMQTPPMFDGTVRNLLDLTVGMYRAQGGYDNIVELLGIAEILDNDMQKISAGQRRRAMIAGVLIIKPDFICADEITNDLDQENSKIIKELLVSVNRKLGIGALIATHDLDWTNYAPKENVLKLEDGNLHPYF
jgi:ABC-type lipoprotein export system ATPase subunit